MRRRGIGGRRPALWLLLAGAAGLLAALLSLRGMAGADPEPVLVARTVIPAGTVIDAGSAPELIGLGSIPAGADLPGLLRDPASALGRRAAAAIAPGEPITDAALGGAPGLGPAPLAPGERAVAAPLSAAGAAGAALGPGARVDVVAATGEGLAGRTEVVVADAEVLGIAEPADGAGLAAGGEVVLRVAARDALRLTGALNFAREVRLLVRPAGESAP